MQIQDRAYNSDDCEKQGIHSIQCMLQEKQGLKAIIEKALGCWSGFYTNHTHNFSQWEPYKVVKEDSLYWEIRKSYDW